jgi:asparagine N-glycosylation enzyme membrane subunit Stt3
VPHLWARALLRAAIRYLAGLTPARTVLWCYLLWYLVVLVRYFDPSPRLWLTSLGLSGIVGLALLLNAGRPLGRWQTARFFLAPFCVSSFSALVKGRGFLLVLSPRWGEVAAGVGICLVFLAAAALAGRRNARPSPG